MNVDQKTFDDVFLIFVEIIDQLEDLFVIVVVSDQDVIDVIVNWICDSNKNEMTLHPSRMNIWSARF